MTVRSAAVLRALPTQLISAIVLMSTLVLAAKLTPLSAQTAPPPNNMAGLRSLYDNRCSACHDLPDPTNYTYTRAEWQTTVDLMLTKYQASDEISPSEAVQIVDYLATFAPKKAARSRPARPWDTQAEDVSSGIPARSSIINFVSPRSLLPLTIVETGPTAGRWHVVPDTSAPCGSVLRFDAPASAGKAVVMLVNPSANGRDVDVSVRFRIDGGKTGSVGLAVGVQDPDHFDIVRCRPADNTLALMKKSVAGGEGATEGGATQSEPGWQILQANRVADPDLRTLAGAAEHDTLGPAIGLGWHILRVQVRNRNVRAWIDATKRISISDPTYAGGTVGLFVLGELTVSFDDWTADIYDPS